MTNDFGDEPPAFDAELYHEQRPPLPGSPRDLHSQSQNAEAEKRVANVQQQRIEVAQAMLSTKAGRDFLAFVLFELCGYTKTTLLADGSHTFSDFRAGQRDIALKMHHLLLRADKSGYVVLLSEHIDQM